MDGRRYFEYDEWISADAPVQHVPILTFYAMGNKAGQLNLRFIDLSVSRSRSLPDIS